MQNNEYNLISNHYFKKKLNLFNDLILFRNVGEHKYK
jgi:hypothetical protein